MKKKLFSMFAVIFALSIMVIFVGAGCDEDGNNGQSNLIVSWTAPGGLIVTAAVDNEALTSGGYVRQGNDVYFAWTGVSADCRVEIHRGTMRLHYLVGNGNWTLPNVRTNQSLVFTVISQDAPDCNVCGDSGEHCVECCDDTDCAICNDDSPSCDVCNDSGEHCIECCTHPNPHCPICCDDTVHCRECCDDTTCAICNEAFIDMRFSGDHRSGLNSWGLYDSEGNRLDTNPVTGGQRAVVWVGDTVTLRWNMSIIDYRITMRFIGTLILMTNAAGAVQTRHSNVLNTGNDWSFTFEVLPSHSVHPNPITMDLRDN